MDRADRSGLPLSDRPDGRELHRSASEAGMWNRAGPDGPGDRRTGDGHRSREAVDGPAQYRAAKAEAAGNWGQGGVGGTVIGGLNPGIQTRVEILHAGDLFQIQAGQKLVADTAEEAFDFSAAFGLVRRRVDNQNT